MSSDSLHASDGAPARPHIDFLDGMRGLAALYVCLTHVWVFGHDDLGLMQRVLRLCMEGGHVAVDVFIVLSGYCLMLPYLDGRPVEIRRFFLRRALRILPCYYVAMALCTLFGLTLLTRGEGTVWSNAVPITWQGFFAHLLLLHDWFASTSSNINYALWSVGVEWKVYFLFPLLVWLGRRAGFAHMAAWVTMLSVAVWVVLYRQNWLNPGGVGSSVYYVGLFAMGMATAAAVDAHHRGRRRIRLPVVLLGIALIGPIAFEIQFKNRGLLQMGSLATGMVACLCIMWLSVRRHSPARRLLSHPVVTTLGRFSYSLYLIHPLMLQLVWVGMVQPYLRDSRWMQPLTYLLSASASIAAAYLFYLAIEAPSVRWTHRVGRMPRLAGDGAIEVAVSGMAAPVKAP